MNTEAELKHRILQEKEAEERLSSDAIMDRIRKGEDAAARGSLLFFTRPARIAALLATILEKIGGEFPSAPSEGKKVFLRFLANLSLDLGSFVPEWRLKTSLGGAEIERLAAAALAALESCSARGPEAAKALTAELRKEAASRLKAEGLADDASIAKEADGLTGDGLSRYVGRIIREVGESNLRTAAKARLDGHLATEIGNDYAAFLDYVLRLGGSFATTNPVLIKMAWDIDPPYWNRKVDEAIASRLSEAEIAEALSGSDAELGAAVEDINNFVTIEVVEGNCRMLRPIFLTTGGEQGYVSLQVNPTAHDDGGKMAVAAASIYAELERRLGGVPNVVIKVPSTAAGLFAAEKLTAQGIGVTVTLTFSLFQALPFARVLQAGRALISYIAIMNGRLAFPVRDELMKGKVEGGAAAARWAGIEVARKAALRMYGAPIDGGLGVDRSKVKIMIASLRIYEDWIPDISELWGIPLITVFPNVRRSYDGHTRELEKEAAAKATPREALAIMLKSEIFRQAWWTPEDGEFGKPDRPLSLNVADAEAVAAFAPVRETLTQFISMYGEMSESVEARMAALAHGAKADGKERKWRK